MSSGEIVPEVMTTLLKRSNTGLIAMAGSMQLMGHLSMWPQTRGLETENVHKVEHRVWYRSVVRFERF